jgi:integrase
MKHRLRLTQTAIARLKAPTLSKKQELYWDETTHGFGVLCSGVSAARSYIVQRDVNGKTRRITIGSVGGLTLETAREEAEKVLQELRTGRDPKSRSPITLRSALDKYIAERKSLAAESVRTYRQIERYLKDWMDLPLVTIDKYKISERHQELANEAGTTSANLAMRVLRIIWNYQARKMPRGAPDLPVNPVGLSLRGDDWFAEPRRERKVATKDLRKFYAAVMVLESPIARDFIRLVTFTGLRKGETSRLKWDDIDFTQRTMSVPAASTKAKRTHLLPLSDYVFDLLVARRKLGKGRYIFEGSRAGGHISDLQGPFARVAELTKTKEKPEGIIVSCHDLRRGFLSTGQFAKVPMMYLKALSNHAPPKDTTGKYIIFDLEDLQQPVQQVCDKLKELCGVEPVTGKNIVKMK